jgi:hypothetical protein
VVLLSIFAKIVLRVQWEDKTNRISYPSFRGTGLKALTGIMLWAKFFVGNMFARWWLDAATAVHFYEAIRARWHPRLAFLPGLSQPRCLYHELRVARP